MSTLKRILPFLILNILISAATTFVVLNLWGGNSQAASSASVPTLAAVVLPTNPPPVQPQVPVETPSSEKLVEIQDVQGPGDLNNEMVLLRRLGDGDLRLTGWRLEDQSGKIFTFPELVLNKGGSIRVYTRTGQNSALNLYWGLNQAVWQAGGTVLLLDGRGVQQASFTIK